MSNKLVKSFMVSVAGLAGLTIVLWGAAKVLDHQQTTKMDALAASFLSQYPSTQTNASAQLLEQHLAALGLPSLESNPDEAQAVNQKIEALNKIYPPLNDYIERQGQKIAGPLDPLPAELKQFLQQHQTELEAIQNHLNTAQMPVWEFNPQELTDLGDSHRSFIRLATLNRLLLIKGIDHHQNQQTTAMLESVQTTEKLNQILAQRPDFLSYLISLITVREQAFVLRHLDDIPPEWTQTLLATDRNSAGREALNFEIWDGYSRHQAFTAEADLLELQHDAGYRLPLFQRMHLSFSTVDLAQAMQNSYPQLTTFDTCSEQPNDVETTLSWWNYLGQKLLPEYIDSLSEGSRRMLEVELSHHVTQAKALAKQQDGQWPDSLPNLASQACPNETWLYNVTPEGKMSLSLSHTFEISGEKQYLPLSYESFAEAP